MSDTSAPNEPHHRRIQTAHEQYFQDIAQTWNALQSQLNAVQTDFERAFEKACQSQQPGDFAAARDEYQRACQASCQDAATGAGYADAYRKYKAAIKDAIANSDVDHLTSGDLNRLGQSLFMVSQTAMCLMPTGQPPLNNPFQAAAPPA
ncbi:hypothetical protein [Bradyrhizobium sp. 188]|uniref:hypothetical protein n=1 Tax=Bradyrhizobium sp. 188 TaxID=2782656 RepID=UPI001FF9DF11|nr:hypothetical protein [Bradyrhizobium sp. 188]MCK1502145.1 hypothetical protein [Bradyrhizobium sp. 188]